MVSYQFYEGYGIQNQFLAGRPMGGFAPPEAASPNPGLFVPGLFPSFGAMLGMVSDEFDQVISGLRPYEPGPSLLASNPPQVGQPQQQQQLQGMPMVPQRQPGHIPMVLIELHLYLHYCFCIFVCCNIKLVM